ncbi:MAG TPA: hypothetical protein VJ867_15160, partial [Gemmatimonadaceae bacterium]|nr:hypothetical protein [Gemmatimonadaceae bacterium]
PCSELAEADAAGNATRIAAMRRRDVISVLRLELENVLAQSANFFPAARSRLSSMDDSRDVVVIVGSLRRESLRLVVDAARDFLREFIDPFAAWIERLRN